MGLEEISRAGQQFLGQEKVSRAENLALARERFPVQKTVPWPRKGFPRRKLIPGRERFPAQKIFQPRVKDILFAGQQLGRILSAKIVVAEIHVHSLTHSAWERFSVQIFRFPFRAETST